MLRNAGIYVVVPDRISKFSVITATPTYMTCFPSVTIVYCCDQLVVGPTHARGGTQDTSGSGCDQLAIHARGGTLDILMTDVLDLVRFLL